MSIPIQDKQGIFIGQAKTKGGFVFNPNEDIWAFNDIVYKSTFDFNTLPLDKEAMYGLKRVFVWYLENHSFSHSYNMFNRLKELLKYVHSNSNNVPNEITSTDLINFKSLLGLKNEYHLGSLVGFLKKWHEMGYKSLNFDAYGYLKEATFKGNPKGEAVLTMCPINGPFTDLELESIQSAINGAYAKGKISKADYLLVWLVMIFGSRMIQFALLKVSDIIAVIRDDASYEVLIKIPRAKNRDKPRSQFKERILPPALAKPLLSYCEEVKKRFEGILNSEHAPLFPSQKEERLGELAYHSNSSELGRKLQNILNQFNIISERTGEKLHISATRFRRTLGTRAASEGHGVLIIAEMLDHTDTQNASVYVQATPEIIKRIDKAMAAQMAPIAQAFEGKLILDKSSAKRANDPDSDIIDPSIDSSCKAMGQCGSFSFCGLMSPIACYTCSSFQAWADGPHEAVLMHLLNEREHLMKTTDYRIASINDRTIFAVAQVVQACRVLNPMNTVEIIA